MGIDPVVAVRVLKEAVGCYEAAGVPVWMQDGTLLGAVREGRTLAHDRDMDLGLMSERYKPEADKRLLEAGFQNLGNYNAPTRHYHQKWSKDGIRFCVFHYYREPDGRIYHGIKRMDYVFVYPREFEIRRIPIGGELIPAPHPPEEWLEIKYGADWRTPVKVWNCRTMPSNAYRVRINPSGNKYPAPRPNYRPNPRFRKREPE